jgi:hypothetical protein
MGVTAHERAFVNALLGTIVKPTRAHRTAMRRSSTRVAHKTILQLRRCLAQVVVPFYGHTVESRRQRHLTEHGGDEGEQL